MNTNEEPNRDTWPDVYVTIETKELESLRTELAAAKEREQGLREMLSSAVCNECRNCKVICYMDGSLSPCPWCEKRRQLLLSQPPQSPRRPIAEAPKDGHPECSICRRRHGSEIQHPCE